MSGVCHLPDLLRVGLLVPAIAVVPGCTNAQMYDMVQSHQEMKCLDQPAAAIQDCLDAAHVPYSDYERRATEVSIAPDGSAGTRARQGEKEAQGARADV